MQTLRGIVNFVQVAELGSFAAAGKALGVSAIAVSKNISRLEKALNVRLFARSTRALALTPEGHAFLEQCKSPLAQLDQACKQASDDAQSASGLVRVTMVSPVAYLAVLPKLSAFYKAHPNIRLHLELSEEVNPIISNRFDVGIRMDALNDAAFVARQLGPLRLLLCASPAYVKAYGAPKNIAELTGPDHHTLQLQVTGAEQPKAWVVWEAASATNPEPRARMVQPQPRFLCNDFRSLLSACSDGLGICQLPQPLVIEALRTGALVQVMPEFTLEGLRLFVHFPSRQQLPKRVRTFVDFIVGELYEHADLTVNPVAVGTSPRERRR